MKFPLIGGFAAVVILAAFLYIRYRIRKRDARWGYVAKTSKRLTAVIELNQAYMKLFPAPYVEPYCYHGSDLDEAAAKAMRDFELLNHLKSIMYARAAYHEYLTKIGALPFCSDESVAAGGNMSLDEYRRNEAEVCEVATYPIEPDIRVRLSGNGHSETLNSEQAAERIGYHPIIPPVVT